MLKKYLMIAKFINRTDGRGRVLTGVSPRHGSHAAALAACDALNAQAVTGREYHYAAYASSPANCRIRIAASRPSLVPDREVMARKPSGSA
jgi:hypothetical protein